MNSIQVLAIFGFDCFGNKRYEAILVLLIKPCPLSIGIKLKKEEFTAFSDKIEPTKPIARLAHESTDGAFIEDRQFAARP